MKTKMKRMLRTKIPRIIKKKYDSITMIAFILASTALSGYYLGFITPHSSTEATAKTTPPISDDEQSMILSNLMDDTVGSCYYDTYQYNGTTYTADICNKAIMFYKEVCKTKHLEACDSDFFKKYLKGMGE